MFTRGQATARTEAQRTEPEASADVRAKRPPWIARRSAASGAGLGKIAQKARCNHLAGTLPVV